MSSPGINPLAIIAPDLYQKQLAISRRQALAQSLMGAGEGSGQGAYGGLANAGKMMLGAYLAKGADQDMGSLYSPQPGTDTGQISNVPPPSSTQQTQPSPQALGSALQGNVQQAQAAPPVQPSQPRTIPNAMSGAIPDLPGKTHIQSMVEYFQSPDSYWKESAATPEYRNALQAAGGDQKMAQQFLLGAALKGASDNVRPGGGSLNYATGQMITMPNTNGVQTTFPQGANGPAQMNMVDGASAALSQSAASQNYGKAETTPAIGYNASNQPVATNQAQMLGANPPLGIRSNNPGNLQPGGREAVYSTPTEGILHASSNLDAYASKGINTVNGIISRWAPPGQNNTPAYTQYVSQKLGVDPNQPIDLKNPAIKGRVLDAIFSYENGPGKMQASGAAPVQNGGLLPELPKGTPEYLQSQGKDAADRHDATVAAASESPMRINVLDNIIGLSKQGVATGPGQDWQNSVVGYAANSPILSKVMGGAQTNVAKFQELQKFTYQNAIRSWQAAGGTGTDAQMQSMAHANPNDHLFPQALQQIAQWGKAAELAVQGKANAQDAFLQQNGQNPQTQIKFESAWRNAFDPKVFQYSIMSPQEKQVFAQHELKTPQAAKAFLAKQQALKQMGAIQ